MIATNWCKGSAAYTANPNGTVVTIGNFDGVHLGHHALLRQTLRCAADLNAATCAFTLDPPPVSVLRPTAFNPRLQTLSEKVATLRALGIDEIVVERFDQPFAELSAEAFARQILGERLRARAVVVGWNFRFGKGRQGSVEHLERWLGIPVHGVEPVLFGDTPVSSSRIRKSIQRGALDDAAALLGRSYAVSGKVEHGSARGRTLGFPTANVDITGRLLPPHGVYAVRATLPNGEHRAGVANLGARPTFGQHSPTLEVHLLDWTGDLYGQHLAVAFGEQLREERAFDGPDALQRQIGLDIEAARAVLR